MTFLINDPLQLDKILNLYNNEELQTLKNLGLSQQYVYSKMTNTNNKV